MLSGHDIPVIPGHNHFTLWAGAHDGAIHHVHVQGDGTMPVIRLTNPNAIYVYRPDTGRYEHERPAVQ